MREIKLANSELVALVDDADYELVSARSWYVLKQKGVPKYAATSIKRNGRNKVVLMHRFILGLKRRDELTDHENHNGFDNQRHNLRLSSYRQNQYNKRKCSTSLHPYKGIVFDAVRDKWRAKIVVDGKLKHLGRFDSSLEAARAYDNAARQYHGVYACTNF